LFIAGSNAITALLSTGGLVAGDNGIHDTGFEVGAAARGEDPADDANAIVAVDITRQDARTRTKYRRRVR
jgi:hypothetical protein